VILPLPTADSGVTHERIGELHRAGATLRQPAAEMRIVQTEVVAERVKQGHVRIGGDGMGASVYAEGKFLTHSGESSCMR
jgi:hypothetical protein